MARRVEGLARTACAANLLVLILIVAPAGALDETESPQIVDPAGDVAVEDAAPLPAGADWADIVALWYTYEPTNGVTMHIRLVDAEEIPPPGEVAARIITNGTRFVTGHTTVLAPFAVPMYQGGFYCTAQNDFSVDPADCNVLDEVALTDGVLRVPLSAGVFKIQPGAVIETHGAYSGAWYAAVQTILDETDPGRPYTVPQTSTPSEELEPPTAQSAAPDTPGDDPTAAPTPASAEAPSALLAPLAVLLLLAIPLARRLRGDQGKA